MKKTVLLVDDDKFFLGVMKKDLAKHDALFSVITAGNGVEAVQQLKENDVSLVVTDMHMPQMDGFGVLAHISKHYPDVQVIVITAFAKPKTEKIVRQQGAVGFFNKPFSTDELARDIITVLEKETEGGSLNNVTLEMFIQLIEMEAKTCTIRVVNKVTEKKGVLFFKEGSILNARIDQKHGNEAAYEIFSWDNPTLYIENSCSQKEKLITGDLQGILLEAMRLKDEATDLQSKNNENQPAEKGEPQNHNEFPDEDISITRRTAGKPEASIVKSPVEQLEYSIKKKLGDKVGLLDVKVSDQWDDIILAFSKLGNFFDSGQLKAGQLLTDNENYIVYPGKETIVITADSKSSCDRIAQSLEK